MTMDSNRVPIQGINYAASSYRLALQALLGGATGSFSGGVSGLDNAHGVVNPDDLEVTALGTPDMKVNVGAGTCFVRGTESDTQGTYPGYNDGTVELTIADADGSNARYSIVGVHVYDSNEGSSDPEDNGIALEVIDGTPASSPADPTLPDNFLPLARVTVGAGVSTITSDKIEDIRPFARAGWSTGWGSEGRIYTPSGITFNTTAGSSGSMTPYLRADRKYRITAACEINNNTVTGVVDSIYLYDITGSTDAVNPLGRWTPTSANQQASPQCVGWYTPPATGTRTYRLRAVSSGSTTNQTVTIYGISFEDIGPL